MSDKLERLSEYFDRLASESQKLSDEAGSRLQELKDITEQSIAEMKFNDAVAIAESAIEYLEFWSDYILPCHKTEHRFDVDLMGLKNNLQRLTEKSEAASKEE